MCVAVNVLPMCNTVAPCEQHGTSTCIMGLRRKYMYKPEVEHRELLVIDWDQSLKKINLRTITRDSINS